MYNQKYICNNCGRVLEDPVFVERGQWLGEFYHTYFARVCPYCGLDDVAEYEEDEEVEI